MSSPEFGRVGGASKPVSRTLQILGLFPQLVGFGGVQQAGRMTAAALREIAIARGWADELLSLNDAGEVSDLEVAGAKLSFSGFGRAKLRFTLAGIMRARSFAQRGQCVLLAAHPHLAVPARVVQTFASGVKTIVMAHGVEVWNSLPGYRRSALRHATLVLAPSRDTVQKLISTQGISPQRVRKLAWPLDPDFLRLAAEPAGLSLPSGFPGGRVVLTVGRWSASERYKGTEYLIQALAQLRPAVPDLHLVAVGTGDDLSRLRQIAADLGLTDRVHFLEALSREQLAACYASAEIFALPSAGEGFGLVFLEAMAFAKPIVAAAAGGAIDLVEDGINGVLVPPGDAQRLATALTALLSDAPLGRRLGRAGAEMVRQKHQLDVFRSDLESVLAECILE